MKAPWFLCAVCMVLMRTLKSRLCYYPLKRTANQKLSMGQGVTAHTLISNRVSILYPLTIRRHRLPGATTDVDDRQADSSQNTVWASRWYLGVQWVPHAEERLSILPVWFWSCFGPVVPGYVPIHCRLNSRQPWQPNGRPSLAIVCWKYETCFCLYEDS